MPQNNPAVSVNNSLNPTISANHRPLEEQDAEQGLDRANLNQLKTRFLELNQQRLTRLRYALLPTQRQFIDLLPLLFHINHPALPGYTTADAPKGIHNFKLSNVLIKSARKINQSFTLQREVNTVNEICGIYLMGSCGSLAHNNRSDIDVWVCPEAQMNKVQRSALKRKCDEISAWADTLHLEVHFFIMHAESFKQGNRTAMGGEDCGNTQHYLLLDEFYRTAIVVAGATPLWWFVPTSFEQDYENYCSILLGKRYLQQHSCIDFGSPGNIPASEYISAGVWHLYKGIESPYKALLKLLLIETYAAAFPQPKNLSSLYKKAIYDGQTDADELDPYLQVYRHIEEYLLGRNETTRLELARRCLYFKVGIKLSSSPEEPDPESFFKHGSDQHQWKRKLMLKLVNLWGWRRRQLIHLDQRQNWPFRNIKAEQAALTKELIHSYSLLSSLIKSQSGPDSNEQQCQDDVATSHRNSMELNLLGRQLYAAFDQKPHKLSQLTVAVAKSTAQSSLLFSQRSEANGTTLWQVALNAKLLRSNEQTDAAFDPEKTSTNPVELLVWCIINGLADNNTRLHVEKGTHDLSEYELRQLYSSLSPLLPQRNSRKNNSQHTINRDHYAKPAKIERCLLVANCGIDPQKHSKALGHWHLSDKTDPLAFSGVAENLISSLSIIVINSWNEVFCYQFDGKNALSDCLIHYYAYCRPTQQLSSTQVSRPPQKHIFCACPSRASAIASRLETLMEGIEDCYQLANTDTVASEGRALFATRYLFESAYGYHVFCWHDDAPVIALFESEADLLASLGDIQTISPIVIDRMALQNHPLSTVARKLESGKTDNSTVATTRGDRICVFYEVEGGLAHTYLADRQLAICYVCIPYDSLRSLVTPIRQFIEQNELRRVSSGHCDLAFNDTDIADNAIAQGVTQQTMHAQEMAEISFYALKKSGSSYQATQLPMESNISAHYFPIKAVGCEDLTGQTLWSIYCNNQEFDQRVLGESVYTAVADSIMQFRQSSEDFYRCYITDIEVTGKQLKHTSLAVDFVRKIALEEKINAAYLMLCGKTSNSGD